MKTGGLLIAALMCAMVATACGGDDDDDDDDDDVVADASAAIDAEVPPPDAACASFTIFVNPTGGTYTPGPDDASTNESSILSEEVTVAAHEPPFGHWEATMECIQLIYAPYDVLITDQDPGSAPHMEVVVTADRSTDIGISTDIPSIAPFSCDVIDGGIAYVFAGQIGTGNGTIICANVGWAAAKFFGLENVTPDSCPDINANSACSGVERSLVDGDQTCGNVTPKACLCAKGETTQNSHARMLEVVGAAQCP